MDTELETLINQQPNLWRAANHGEQSSNNIAVLDSQHDSLNKALHGGGWPLGCNNELYLPFEGIGELRLLIPALRHGNTDSNGYIFWIAPPFLPFAPALAQQHIDLKKLIIVNAETTADTLWATEQAMLSGSCNTVFSWFGQAPLGMRELRRLQLAARKHNCWHVLFRHQRCANQVSASSLRMSVNADKTGQLDLHILKQPGGWSGQDLRVSVSPHYEQWQRLPVDLLPFHTHQNLPNIGDNPPPQASSVHPIENKI
ncbi:Uncharacterised protein [BD1-7 clade bacterium]|uniref:Cell division inhibitor SulA n=1 Tax=BD1-7 clade bacterium TaxID=2029982 RepID=A0A5S9QNV1_9GAMM|nr:Uncharacterised protein [BD1-7 clade bacterium]CAA0121010.1 Uncharacterised protein [BD1-7 clade bacterium]